MAACREHGWARKPVRSRSASALASASATAARSATLRAACASGDRDDATLRGFAAQGLPVERKDFAFRSDDLIVVWQAVRAGLGIGFVSEHQLRLDPAVHVVLPKVRIEPLPVWLAVHKEIRTSKRIRAVYDFLSDALPRAI